jgi:hypothetical protein
MVDIGKKNVCYTFLVKGGKKIQYIVSRINYLCGHNGK